MKKTKNLLLTFALMFVMALSSVMLVACGANPKDKDGDDVPVDPSYAIEFSGKYSLDGENWIVMQTQDGKNKLGVDSLIDEETEDYEIWSPISEMAFNAEELDGDLAKNKIFFEFKLTNNTDSDLYYGATGPAHLISIVLLIGHISVQ